jgi:hypothetical protein
MAGLSRDKTGEWASDCYGRFTIQSLHVSCPCTYYPLPPNTIPPIRIICNNKTPLIFQQDRIRIHSQDGVHSDSRPAPTTERKADLEVRQNGRYLTIQ